MYRFRIRPQALIVNMARAQRQSEGDEESPAAPRVSRNTTAVTLKPPSDTWDAAAAQLCERISLASRLLAVNHHTVN
jgi:hypothetical protein